MILADYPGSVIATSLVLGAAAAVWFAYRSDIVRNTGAWRWLLAAMQFAAALAVVVIIWDPSVRSLVDKSTKNTVLVIFDTSESMSVQDEGDARIRENKAATRNSRLDRAIESFRNTFKPGEPGSPYYEIHGFDAACYASASTDALRRWGRSTNAHAAMSLLDKYDIERLEDTAGVLDSKGSKVVGAVIYTDGQADDKNVESYFPLKKDGLKALIVGVGSEEVQRDLAVTSLRVPASAALDTAYALEADVTATGMASTDTKVTLYIDGAPIDAKICQVKDAEPATLRFDLAANALGRHRVTARAEMSGGEANLANNTREAVLNVVETPRMKVLLYSRTASFDIGKIRSSLERDKKIDLDVGLDAIISQNLSEQTNVPRQTSARKGTRPGGPEAPAPKPQVMGGTPLPADKQGFYAYDVIILGPIGADALTREQAEGLYSFVAERGGGLVVLSGRDEFDVSAWTDEKMKALLPIETPGNGDVDVLPKQALEITTAGAEGGLEATADSAQSPAAIAAHHASAVTKPAAYIWAKSADAPIVTVHRVGRGKVCFINAHGLHGWYREDVNGGVLRRFLSSLTGALGRIRSSQSKVEVFAARHSQDPLRVSFDASVYDDSWASVEGATVLLEAGGQTVRMQETAKGRYSAEVSPIEEESALVTVSAEKGGSFIGERMFAATLPRPRMEMDHVERDGAFLKALAKRTGAQYCDISNLNPETASMFPATSKYHEGGLRSAWRTWWLLVALCLLLSATWFVRRSIGLI